jgi:hypothetical protein
MAKFVSNSLDFQVLSRFGVVQRPKKVKDVSWATPKRNNQPIDPSYVIDPLHLFVLSKPNRKGIVGLKFHTREHASKFALLLSYTDFTSWQLTPYPTVIDVKHVEGNAEFILNQVYKLFEYGEVLYDPKEDAVWQRRMRGKYYPKKSFREVLIAEVQLLQDYFVKIMHGSDEVFEKIPPSISELLDGEAFEKSKKRLALPGWEEHSIYSDEMIIATPPREDSFIDGDSKKILQGVFAEGANKKIIKPKLVTFDKEYNLVAKLYKRELKKQGYRVNLKGSPASMAISSWYTKLYQFIDIHRTPALVALRLALKNIATQKEIELTGILGKKYTDVKGSYARRDFREGMITGFGRSSKYRAKVSKEYSDFFLKTLKSTTFNNNIKNLDSSREWEIAAILFFPVITLVWKMYSVNYEIFNRYDKFVETPQDTGLFEKYFQDLFSEMNRTKNIPQLSTPFTNRTRAIIKKLK